MALTAAQMTDVRRWMGYQLAGTTQPINADQDLVYGQFGMVTMSLYQRLTTLSPSEEAVLINTYLTPLASLETDILGSAENLDTAIAAVWTRNQNEIGDRTALFKQWCRQMCAFIGFAPGPGLQQNNSIVRC